MEGVLLVDVTTVRAWIDRITTEWRRTRTI